LESDMSHNDEKKTPLTSAERKRAQRKRDKSQGYTEIMVRVPADRADEARAWCAKLKPKRKVRDVSQTTLFGDDCDLSRRQPERSEVSA